MRQWILTAWWQLKGTLLEKSGSGTRSLANSFSLRATDFLRTRWATSHHDQDDADH